MATKKASPDNKYITDAELEATNTPEPTPVAVAKSDKTLSEKLQTARNTKSYRIYFIIALLVILFVLWWFKIIKTGFVLGIGFLLLVALGIETFNYDIDLGKLWETGSVSESRVSHTKDGLVLMGSCAIPTKGEGDLNCSNFKTQAEAQAKYDLCASEIVKYNKGVDASKVRSLDIYGLDGNKNGIVCEHLPKRLTPAQ